MTIPYGTSIPLSELDEKEIARLVSEGCRSGHLSRDGDVEEGEKDNTVNIYWELKVNSWQD